MRHSRLIVLLFLLLAAAGCGTAVFEHRIEIAVEDPAGRLGTPVEVSIFDPYMGRSEEWARKTMGVSSASAPHVARVTATATKMVFDASLPAAVTAALVIPAYETQGYFHLDLRPVAGVEEAAAVTFVPWGDPVPDVAGRAPLRARYRSEPAEIGWRIHLTVEIPPASAGA
jgi:hypothetical protein